MPGPRGLIDFSWQRKHFKLGYHDKEQKTPDDIRNDWQFVYYWTQTRFLNTTSALGFLYLKYACRGDFGVLIFGFNVASLAGGGNCTLTKAGESYVTDNGVRSPDLLKADFYFP